MAPFLILIIVGFCGGSKPAKNAAVKRAVFVHWGHRGCQQKDTTVYTGFTAGGHYSHYGGQTNPLCLPSKPQLIPLSDQPSYSYYSYIYGSEYQTQGGPNVSLNNHDVPCTVCRTRGVTTLMIAGYQKCPNQMRLAYDGFLMGGYYGHAGAHESVCMDKEMQSLRGGIDDQNGLLWYFVTAQTGSLPEPPYKQGSMIPCVVCVF